MEIQRNPTGIGQQLGHGVDGDVSHPRDGTHRRAIAEHLEDLNALSQLYIVVTTVGNWISDMIYNYPKLEAIDRDFVSHSERRRASAHLLAFLSGFDAARMAVAFVAVVKQYFDVLRIATNAANDTKSTVAFVLGEAHTLASFKPFSVCALNVGVCHSPGFPFQSFRSSGLTWKSSAIGSRSAERSAESWDSASSSRASVSVFGVSYI